MFTKELKTAIKDYAAGVDNYVGSPTEVGDLNNIVDEIKSLIKKHLPKGKSPGASEDIMESGKRLGRNYVLNQIKKSLELGC